MGQSEILSTIQLALFQDAEMKKLLLLTPDTNLATFRDKHCIANYNSTEMINKDVKCRLVVSWAKTTPLSNPETAIRTLSFDIFVHKDVVYTASAVNALIRRQDLIQQQLKKTLHNKRVQGFKFRCIGLNDAISGNPDYVKAFILFDVKYIYY